MNRWFSAAGGLGFVGVLGLVLVAALLAIDIDGRPALQPEAQGVWAQHSTHAPLTQTAQHFTVEASGLIPMPDNTPAAHASNLLPMPSQHSQVMWAFWFAGTRESAPDVQVAASAFDRASQAWTPSRWVVNRESTGISLGFAKRRLGNPVPWRDASGRVHLFVVATGLGGWAAGRVLHLQSKAPVDSELLNEVEFEPLRVLPLAWGWNISHLVRAMPLVLADGGMVLPVYFELSSKYPVALRFDALGNFRGMVRMSQERKVLQPTLLMQSPTQWLALMRDSSSFGRVQASQTQDAGRSWTDLPMLSLHNADNSLAGLSLSATQHVLVHNPQTQGRHELDLSVSADGLLWQEILTLVKGSEKGDEKGGVADEFSYPSVVWQDQHLWVSYTYKRQAIAWQRLLVKETKAP